MLEDLIKYLKSPEKREAPFILEAASSEESLDILVQAIQEMEKEQESNK